MSGKAVPTDAREPSSADAAVLGRRERGKREKRERIKAAARALFAEKGFAGTTTQEIAARADIGTGTLFLYVQSKEEVLVLVFRDEMDRVCEAAFRSLPRTRSLLDQLMYVYGSLVEFHDRDQGLARVFVKEVLFVKETNRRTIYEFVEGLIGRTARLVEEAKERGELDASVPAQVLAENCFAAYLLRLQKWLGLREKLATDEHADRLRESFELQLRGLAPLRMRRARGGRSPRRKRS
jgi:AcrR family transcriptional regulator